MNLKDSISNFFKSKRNVIVSLIIVVLTMFLVILSKNLLVKLDKTPVNTSNISMKRIYVEDSKLGEENYVAGYDKIYYTLKYTLQNPEKPGLKKNVFIELNLKEEDASYANFEEVADKDITSEVEDGRKLKLQIKNVEVNVEQTVKVAISVNGAPNGYQITPSVKINVNESDTDYKGEAIEVKTTSVSGTIKDKKTKDSVSDLQLSLCKLSTSNICEEEKVTYTDKNGNYTFSDISSGNYKINVI